MYILRTEGLTRQYGEGQTIVTALDHVDLQVERGQFVAIIGHQAPASQRCSIF